MAKIDVERLLTTNLPAQSGQRAFQAARQSSGLGSAQGVFAAMEQPVPAQMPKAAVPAPSAPTQPSPQPAAAPQPPPQTFETMLESARPSGWPAVFNVFDQQLQGLWSQGDKDAYDATFRRFMVEEQQAAGGDQ